MDRRKALTQTGLLAMASMSVTSLTSMLQSCQQESRLDWQPQYFREDEARFISKLVDLILPKTETPGALDVKVDLFIDKFVSQAMDPAAQQSMRNAIRDFNAQCEEDFGSSFVKLSSDQQQAALQQAETSSAKFNAGVWGTAVGEQEPISFYRSLKSMAIWAYMTSEEIGKNVLNYDPIPQEYQGCIPLDQVGNRWSL